MEPAFAPKPGKARLSSLRHSAKEPVVGLVKALERGALEPDREIRGFKIASAPLCELACLAEIGNRDPRFAIGSDALFERRVVELALGFEDALQGPVLGFAGQQAIATAENHHSSLVRHKLAT
jgi:hypothetical protein